MRRSPTDRPGLGRPPCTVIRIVRMAEMRNASRAAEGLNRTGNGHEDHVSRNKDCSDAVPARLILVPDRDELCSIGLHFRFELDGPSGRIPGARTQPDSMLCWHQRTHGVGGMAKRRDLRFTDEHRRPIGPIHLIQLWAE
jgi:hypothetical protein